MEGDDPPKERAAGAWDKARSPREGVENSPQGGKTRPKGVKLAPRGENSPHSAESREADAADWRG